MTVNNNDADDSDNDGDNDNDDDDDVPLLVLDDENTSAQNIYATDAIGLRLQSILYHYVAEPVIKGRIVIFMIYLFILGGCAFLVTKLEVSCLVLSCLNCLICSLTVSFTMISVINSFYEFFKHRQYICCFLNFTVSLESVVTFINKLKFVIVSSKF